MKWLEAAGAMIGFLLIGALLGRMHMVASCDTKGKIELSETATMYCVVQRREQ